MRNLAAPSFCAAILAFCAAVLAAAPPPGERKTVMFLVPWDLYRPSAAETLQGLHRGFSQAMSGQVEILAEHIPANSQDLAWFEAKYRNRKVDAAITILDGLLTTMQPTAATLVAGRAGGSCQQPADAHAGSAARTSATLTVTMSYLETAKLAVRLRPDTRRIVIVNGATASNRLIGGFWADEVRRNLLGLEVVEWSGLSAAEMKERASRLEPHSVCLLGFFSADRDGLPLTHNSIAAMLVPVMNAPSFDYLDSSLGTGVVGGWMSDLEVAGEETAAMTVEVLRGTPPAMVANRRSLAPGYRFDERQLARWGILTSQLPAGSRLLFHEPTLWERHGTFLAATYASLVLLVSGSRWVAAGKKASPAGATRPGRTPVV